MQVDLDVFVLQDVAAARCSTEPRGESWLQQPGLNRKVERVRVRVRSATDSGCAHMSVDGDCEADDLGDDSLDRVAGEAIVIQPLGIHGAAGGVGQRHLIRRAGRDRRRRPRPCSPASPLSDCRRRPRSSTHPARRPCTSSTRDPCAHRRRPGRRPSSGWERAGTSSRRAEDAAPAGSPSPGLQAITRQVDATKRAEYATPARRRPIAPGRGNPCMLSCRRDLAVTERHLCPTLSASRHRRSVPLASRRLNGRLAARLASASDGSRELTPHKAYC